MLKLLMLREQFKKVYSLNSRFLTPVFKFVATLISMIIINTNIGAMGAIKNPVVVLAISIVGAFLPATIMVMMLLLIMVAHILVISVTSAAVILVTYIIMYLLFFRFSSKYSYILLLTPLCFILKIPFIIPVMLGLCGTPVTIVPMIFGTLIYFYINYFAKNFDTLVLSSSEEAVTMMTAMANSIFKNPTFFFTIGTFAVVICLVYFVKKLSIDYSWMISAISGGLLSIIVMLIGCVVFDMSSVFTILSVLIGGIISTIIAWLVQFLVHSVDYSRTEVTQFEDDEYYYYVKAVPKIQVLPPEKSIKRINAKKVNKKDTKKKK